ncbi:MAG: UDP-N-acetylmuramoyl-L-alanine--D-glutamate ligase [Patescibacteria group bacterium]
MDAPTHFRGKRITLMRIGLLGRGIGDAAYLAECGADVLVVDDASQEVMQPAVDALKAFKNITFKFGPYDLNDFKNCDLVLKGAGTPIDSPEIAEAKKNDIPVRMSADLFLESSGVTCVGVTGTRGKSTVTHMIFAILKEAGKKVLLGGNIRGVSNLELLKEVTPEHVAVLELDSWQCQGFGEAQMSPHTAVFTTLFADHMNYYKEDLNAYLADKANIFLYQHEEDTLILGKQCAPIVIDRYGEQIEAQTQVIDETKLPDTWILKVPGMHNRYNAALALAAARALGVADEVSRAALAAFSGVPGRLELVREVNGVKIYNDTTATTPEATLVALAALGTERTVLIMGGNDKNLDMTALIEKVKEVKHLVLLAGTGTERIKDQLDAKGMIYHTFAEAVADAVKAAAPGDTILFSPAFTSFGMFKNEFDRGDQFNALVNAL